MEKEKKELTITVSGQFCSGKSRLIFLLKKLLREQGFEVNYEGNLDHPNEHHFDKFMSKDFDEIMSGEVRANGETFKGSRKIILKEAWPKN